MPKQSKSKTEVTETPTAVTAPVVAPVETTTKSSKQPKKAPVVAAPVVVAPVVVAPVVDAPVVDAPVVADSTEIDAAELASQSSEFFAKITQLGSMIASLKTEYRSLEKKWSREIKIAQKSNSKRKRKSGNRQPSGFVKPTKISDELANFLDKPVGTEMARTDVTREINKYIRSQNLQDTKNGRKINPDTRLQTLLKLQNTDELTYFNLQRYMSPHFYKSEKVTVSASTSA
jgi:chromatin remodeling complex protein RSC6